MSLLLWTFAGSLLPFFPPVAFSCIHDLPPPMSYAVVFSFYLFQYIPCFINALRIYLVLFHNIGLRVFFISSMGKQSSTSSSCGLYPSTWSAACVVCASKLSRQVTSLSMTQGPFNLLTDCCTNYHNNCTISIDSAVTRHRACGLGRIRSLVPRHNPSGRRILVDPKNSQKRL